MMAVVIFVHTCNVLKKKKKESLISPVIISLPTLSDKPNEPPPDVWTQGLKSTNHQHFSGN